MTTGAASGLLKLAPDGTAEWRAFQPERLWFSGLGVAADGHLYVARVKGQDGYPVGWFTGRVAADGSAAAEVCSSCGSNLGFAVSREDAVAYLRHQGPDVPVPPVGIAVVAGHETGTAGTLILPGLYGSLAFDPDGHLVVAGSHLDPDRSEQVLFIWKTTTEGRELWRVGAPAGVRFDRLGGEGLAVAGDGTVVVTARVFGAGQWGADVIEAPDGRNYLFAVASDGTRRWARPMSALPYDPPRLDISVAASAGHVYLAAANGCGTTSVHKYDTAGTWLATTDLRTSACPPESQPNTPRLVVGPSAVFVSGPLAGTMRVGNTSITATTDETAFIVKLTP